MILVRSGLWYGDLESLKLEPVERDMIINAPVPEQENYRVGPYIICKLTAGEERCLKQGFPKYYDNPEKYAGTPAAELVFEAMCGIRYGRPSFARPDANDINWETGELIKWW